MKILAVNQRANFDYEIKNTFVSGLVLSGAEVKSIKNGNISLAGSYVTTNNNEANLINAHIGPYKYARQENYNPTQNRKLLIKKSELNELIGKEKGLIIIPLKIFQTKQGWIKLTLGTGKAKKKKDKRESIKKRDIEREIRKNF